MSNIFDSKICLFDGVSESAINFFKDKGFKNLKIFPSSLPTEELKNEIKDAVALGIRSATKITKDIIEGENQIKCIGRYGIGVNNIDIKSASTENIAIFNGPFSSTRSVAEMVIGSIFDLSRKISQKSKDMHAGIWNKSSKNCNTIIGKTLGLIGYGNIAVQVSIMAEALGMNVIFFDIRTVLPMGKAKQVSIDEVFQKSDVISLHVPELESTKNMINKNTIVKIKTGSLLINFARGSVVNITDLKEALISGQVGGAALDVFPEEPKSNTEDFKLELQNINNVILTPHIAGSTEESQEALGAEVSGKMVDCILNNNVSSALNREELIF